MKTSVVSVFVEPEIACPDENLGDSIINITFIEDKLASFRISTRLDINNGEIKKNYSITMSKKNMEKLIQTTIQIGLVLKSGRTARKR